jgi:hypothetical protein
MVLREKLLGTFGGGGGNSVSGTRSLTGHTHPVAGDTLVIIINAQFGLLAPPSQPTFTVSDDAGNTWVNVGDLFDGSGIETTFEDRISGAYSGAFVLSTWICYSHNGNTLNTISVSSSAVANAWDQEGGFSYSDWSATEGSAQLFTYRSLATATNAPSVGPFTPPAGTELVIASFFAGLTGTSLDFATGSAGYTKLASPAGSYYDEYKIAPSGAQTTALAAPDSVSHWLVSALCVITASVLAVTPLSRSFTGKEGGSNPAFQTFAISNSGGGVLTWTTSGDSAWLTAGTSSGTGAATVHINVDLAGLSSGVYTGHITVSAPGSADKVVTVTLIITAAYLTAGGFTSSAVEHKSDTSADNLEVTHFLNADIISEADLRAQLYDFADVELRVVSWEHPEYGSLKLLKGTLGQVTMKNGQGTTELRGLTQKASTVVGSTHGPVCRADLFDGKWATGDAVADPGNHWRCRKDPTAYTFARAVDSSPDALTIVPATALPSVPLPTSNNTKVTLNGVTVQAAFVARTHSGAFDLAFSGDAGTPGGGGAGAPYIFDSSSHATIAATATGNSLMFNANGLYSSLATISEIEWNLLNSVGNFVSASAPWSGATEHWEAMIYGQLYIPVAGHVTFNVLHDDGCLFAMVPTADHPTDYVSIVSGPQTGPGTSNLNLATGPLNQKRTAFNGYYFGNSLGNRYVASDNRQGNRSQNWTLNFPAAGTYNFEFCFTNYEHRQQFVVTVAGQGNILPDNLSAAAGTVSAPFDGGAIKITSGALAGRVFDVQTVDEDGNIKLYPGAPFPSGLLPGDTFLIQAACNRLISDCKFKYDNVKNFAAENQMPGNLVVLSTPDTH